MFEHALIRSGKSCSPTGLTCTLRRNLTRMQRTQWSTRRSGWGDHFIESSLFLPYSFPASVNILHLNDIWLKMSVYLWTSEQEMIPFAVVGSDQEYQVNGRRLLGRKTKWGTIEGTDCSPSFLRLPLYVKLCAGICMKLHYYNIEKLHRAFDCFHSFRVFKYAHNN